MWSSIRPDKCASTVMRICRSTKQHISASIMMRICPSIKTGNRRHSSEQPGVGAYRYRAAIECLCYMPVPARAVGALSTTSRSPLPRERPRAAPTPAAANAPRPRAAHWDCATFPSTPTTAQPSSSIHPPGPAVTGCPIRRPHHRRAAGTARSGPRADARRPRCPTPGQAPKTRTRIHATRRRQVLPRDQRSRIDNTVTIRCRNAA